MFTELSSRTFEVSQERKFVYTKKDISKRIGLRIGGADEKVQKAFGQEIILEI